MIATTRHSWTVGCGAILTTLLFLVLTGTASALPDNRGWELVSPVEKNGGQVDPPGAIDGGGVLQAAAAGGAVTYGSRASFAGGVGAPPASQYISVRSGGWVTANITPPIFSGSYDIVDQGAPFQLFSPDLARGLILNGDHCRGGAEGCAVANPPLPGTDAPEGYQNYYLLENGSWEALVGDSDIAGRGIDPKTFDLRFEGASPDLTTIVLASCSPLAAGAVDGCGTGAMNLYKWTKSSGSLTLVNAAPGAELAADATAVSTDGSRIYWEDLSGNLYLREGAVNKLVDSLAGGGEFQAASSDGTVAFYTKAGHLWRYAGGSSADLTPAGGVVGVLGASAGGTAVYYQDASALKLWSAGSTTTVANNPQAALPSDYPPATGTARVSDDGTKLVFVTKAQLNTYNNTDKFTGLPDSEVYLFDTVGNTLRCISCNPTGKRPIGGSTIPGAYPNGSAPGSFAGYKPRVLSSSGHRIFLESHDALTITDSNLNSASQEGVVDVYEWEADGEGTCAKSGGCIDILSNGSAADGAVFFDASSDGSDAYFLTETSLVGYDPGSVDLYDARVGGGFPEPQAGIPCEGDACQELPGEPSDPTITTLVPGLGNPPVQYRKYCRRGYYKKKGICVKKGAHKHHKHRHKHKRHHKKRNRGRGA